MAMQDCTAATLGRCSAAICGPGQQDRTVAPQGSVKDDVAMTSTAIPSPHRIFVFGTLQAGHRNFHVNRGARVGDHVVTAQPHPLYLIGRYRLPWLLNRPGEGMPVVGQLYAVDETTLAAMDVLERLDDPLWYQRRRIRVRPQDAAPGVAEHEAWVYFGSEAGFAGQAVHAGPLAQYTLEVAAQHPLQMPPG